MKKNILSLSSLEIKDFLLKHESYVNIDLPPYISFTKILKESEKLFISKNGNHKSIKDLYRKDAKDKNTLPKHCNDVNYKLFHNKDGNLDWRQFELINPILYVSLVLQISNNWESIKKRLNRLLEISSIECMSLPIVSETKKKDKAEQILSWWESIEQKSIEYSLDYQYLYHSDISNCYGSLYTHSIPWSLHSKRLSKCIKRPKNLIGDNIDSLFQSISYGQTNGIPQGSVAMDLVAEFVLLYIDACFTQILKRKYNKKIFSKIKIIRYRDDYRIFTNNITIAENCLKELSQLMIEFGFKLNASKTIASENVILGSIKTDKIKWLSIEKDATTIQKRLLILHKFLQENKNSGISLKCLNDIYTSLSKLKEKNLKSENINVLISIVVDIAYNNTRTYPVSMAIISSLLMFLKDEEKDNIISKVVKKFKQLPNTGHLDIWLQRAIIKQSSVYTDFKEDLCKAVNGKDVILWNYDWLNEADCSEILNIPIIDNDVLNGISETVKNEEFDIFKY